MTALSPEKSPTEIFGLNPWTTNEKKALWGLVFFAALLRLAFIGINQGEYTDGILQITQFSREDSFWPPLYTLLAWPLRQIGLSNIWAGRVVSWASSVLFIWPLVWLTRRYAGNRASLYALAFYAVSAIAMIADMWSRPLEACDFNTGRCPRRVISWITILSVLAALTRYQGLLLLPLVMLCAARVWWSGAAVKKARLTATLVQAAWLLLPIWQMFQNFAHDEQFASRVPGETWWQIALNYWGRLEEFIVIMPYAFTMPVFAFSVFGLFVRRDDSKMPIKLLFGYAALAILAAQTLFMSFQTRYLLPLLPFVLTFAGQGAVAAAHRLRNRRWAFYAVMTVTLLWSLAFALSVMYFQRGAFGDLYKAGYYIASISDLPPDAKIYTNEVYGPYASIVGIHLKEASGRQAALIPDIDPRQVNKSMEPGSLVVLNSRSAEGWKSPYIEILQKKYDMQPMPGAVFESRLVPILPDILSAGGEQSASAWPIRYQPQQFQTRVFYVRGLR